MKTYTAILLMLAPFGVAAQTVYKCPGDDGTTIYSQRPCSTDESKVERVTVRVPASARATTGEGDSGNGRNVPWSQLATDEARCIELAVGNIMDPTNERIARLQADVDRLEARAFYAEGKPASVAQDVELEERIGKLRRLIAQERTSAEHLAAMARQRCSEDRRRREAELLGRNDTQDEAATPAPREE